MKNAIILIYGLLFLLTSVLVSAHGNIIYNIDLDFDKELESKTIKKSQEYSGINENPKSFDFDRELIKVNFDRKLEYSILINPSDYSVSGVRDNSLIKKDGKINFNQKQRKEIAEKMLDTLPKEIRSELTYGEEEKLYLGTYVHKWYRYIDGVFVSNEYLEVEIDATNGKIVSWRLSIFSYPSKDIQTSPAISHSVAQQIAQIKFGAKPTEFEPILVIEKNKPVWITKVKSLYPFYVGIDALTGEVLYSGGIKTELPKNYDTGREIKITENDLIKSIIEG